MYLIGTTGAPIANRSVPKNLSLSHAEAGVFARLFGLSMACVMQVQLRPVHRGRNVSIRREAARGSGRDGERKGSAVHGHLRRLVQPLRPLHETRPAAAVGAQKALLRGVVYSPDGVGELETDRSGTSTG